MPFSGIISDKIDELLAKNKTAFAETVSQNSGERIRITNSSLIHKVQKKLPFCKAYSFLPLSVTL